MKHFDYEPPAITPGKGLKGQNCNVTACQKPDSAHHFNSATNAYYCEECAKDIEKWARKDGMSFFESLKDFFEEKKKKVLERILSPVDDFLLINIVEPQPYLDLSFEADEAVVQPKKVVAKLHRPVTKPHFKPIKPIPVKKQGFRR